MTFHEVLIEALKVAKEANLEPDKDGRGAVYVIRTSHGEFDWVDIPGRNSEILVKIFQLDDDCILPPEA